MTGFGRFFDIMSASTWLMVWAGPPNSVTISTCFSGKSARAASMGTSIRPSAAAVDSPTRSVNSRLVVIVLPLVFVVICPVAAASPQPPVSSKHYSAACLKPSRPADCSMRTQCNAQASRMTRLELARMISEVSPNSTGRTSALTIGR